MAVQVTGPSNILLPQVQRAPAQQKTKGFFARAFSSLRNTVNRPVQYCRYWCWSTTPQKVPLKRIDQAADWGLQRASVRGIQRQPVTAELQRSIDQLLDHSQAAAAAKRNAAEVGPPAYVPGMIPDPDVTRAPTAQARVDATNWKKQIEDQSNILTNKLSAFTTLMQMRERCGATKRSDGSVESNNLGLMNLVKRATEGQNPESIWSLFTGHYELSFFQKLKAFWFYWFYYQTSLITNTVNAYLGSFIKNLTDDLTQDSDHTRNLLFQGVLRNANQFLVEDIQATKDFAFERDHGDLEDYRDRAIERHYGFSLIELCRKVSEKQVNKNSPEVRFFKDFQEIPVLGWFFTAFEWFVNKFIIQSSMKSWILPNVLEPTVNKGLEATQPHNLPFTISMTKFFTSQLERLSLELQNGEATPSAAPAHFPGTEMLSPMIKNLLLALNLEKYKTGLELRKKFAEIEKGKWVVGRNIEESIEKAINDSAALLFIYLNDTAKSGELFARMLKLSCEPFSSEVTDPELLLAEYEEERLKLERTAKVVFKEIVRQAVAKKTSLSKPQTSKPAAKKSFKDQQVVASTIMGKLEALCTQMEQKIAHSRRNPSDQNDIQTDIVVFLQTMQVFANRKELQDQMQGIDGVDRNELWRIFTPLFERAERIQQRVLRLQGHQDNYPQHARVVTNLQSITELLRSIRDQFHAQPRHLQTTFIQIPAKATEEIIKCLGSKAPVSIKLTEWIAQLTALSQSISKEQEALDAFHAIYPPRNDVNHATETGLLDQLLSNERGNPPPGFRLRTCLSEMNRWLGFLPENERIELQVIIGDGTNIWSKYDQLSAAMQRIYSAHVQAQHRDKLALDATLNEATEWTEGKIAVYTMVKEQDHGKMRLEMGCISEDVRKLQQDIQQAQLRIPQSLSTWTAYAGVGIISTIGYEALTGLGSLIGYPWLSLGMGTASMLAGTLGGGVAKYFVPASKSSKQASEQSRFKKVMKCVVPLAGGIYAACQLPGLIAATGTSLGSALCGWYAVEGLQSYSVNQIFDEVWEIVENANEYRLAPRIYKAATTRLLVESSA